MPSGAYTIRNRSRNVDYVLILARGVTKFYIDNIRLHTLCFA